MKDENARGQRESTSQSGEILDEAVAGYLRAVETGENPSRDELLNRHPELAYELREFFADHDRMNRLAQPLCEPTLAQPASAGAERIRYFGDYEVLEEIARGGMGVVFKARQVTLNRIVAIKMILSGQLASPVDVERFHTEAEAAAKLDHPAIVPVYEVGLHDGQHYFSMGFVDGQSLSARITNGPLPARDAAELVCTVAKAVQYAHERGVIHRDLKPGNILLDRQGKPRITDFGLAKLTESHSDLTGTGQVLGTPGYMPPEQAAAQASAVGHLSDIYSLGAILYCLLTGRPPFQAATPLETLLQVQRQEPVPPRQLNPAVPLDLDTIVLKCLEKSPARRYSTAQEVADELKMFLDGRPIVARPISRTAKLWRASRRNPLVASLAALLLVALVAVTMTSSLAYFREFAHRHEIERKNDEIGRALTSESQAKDDATDRLYRSLVDQARANRLSRRMGQRYKSLEILKEASRMACVMSRPEEDLVTLRSEVIACLTLTDVRTAKEWQGFPSGSFHAEFDRALERYARVDRNGKVSVRRVTDDFELYQLAGMGPWESWTLLSPDGQFLKRFDANGFKIWHLAGAEPNVVLAGPPEHTAFSPDSRQITTRNADGVVTLFELPSGRQLKQFKTGIGGGDFAYHPQGQHLALCCQTGIQICDLESGTLISELNYARGTQFVAWHPDGNTLGAVGNDRVIQLWDVASGMPTIQLKGHTNDGIMFTFNHRGDLLASTGWGQPLRLWDPRTAELIFQTSVTMQSIRFSQDDRRLACVNAGNGALQILEIAQVRKFYRTLVRDPVLGRGSYHLPAVSPDGRLLAVGMQDGVGLWDFISGNPLTFLPSEINYAVLFEPEGPLLASGSSGVVRWPIEVDSPAPGMVRIGRPERLPLPGPSNRIGMSKDGRVVAKAMGWGGLVWHQDLSQPPIRLEPHGDARFIAVTPDGRWVATGSYSGTLVKIWNALTGKHECDLPVDGRSNVVFSPDGRWLATHGEGLRLWTVDTWQEARYVGGYGIFSPDGKILAVETNGLIRLVNPDTGLDYARIEDLHLEGTGSLSFSPDGTQLVATNNESNSIHVWNLRAIREQLVEMGLDWDLPSYRPAGASPPSQTLRMAPEVSRTLKAHSAQVASVAFNPAGTLIASGSSDRAIRLWETSRAAPK